MSTVAIDNIAYFLCTSMSLHDRQLLAAQIIQEPKENILTPMEQNMVEEYLLERAEAAADRIEAGEFVTQDEMLQAMNNYIHLLQATA